MGAMMGAGVGLTIGFLFGSYSILRNGAGPRGVMATLSQYMLGSAASFTFFLSIGSAIRNDAQMDAMQYRLAQPVMHSRISGASLIRARWEAEKEKRNDI
ncbi:MGR2 [Sanghuangporus weigelae]